MLSLIIPTYNEKENIKNLILKINRILRSNFEMSEILKKSKISEHHQKNKNFFEIIIVDDNSPDGTGKIVDKLSKYNVRCIHRKGKLGLSSAVIEGFSKAKEDIIGVMDADFSHPPEIIPEMIKHIEDNDLVIGSRYVKNGKIENWSMMRKIISKGATLLSLPLTTVKDPMSGFFFLKKNVIKGIKLNTKGFKILLEIIVKGNYKKVKEVPYIFVDRKKGKSKLNKKEYFDYLKNLFNLLKYKLFN